MEFWKKSIESYTKSLSLRADKETEENLAFVKEKLQKEEENQAQKKLEEQQKKKEKADLQNQSGSTQKN
jgi:hypothetical protein